MELIVVLIIALIVLGPKKLPDAGKSVGKGIREFKDAITGGNDDEKPAPIAAVRDPAPVAERPPAA
jgi:sec-independent protein translocase protein TatA